MWYQVIDTYLPVICCQPLDSGFRELDPVGAVDDTIENGIGQGGITDGVVPLLDRELTGDQRRSAAVPILYDFKQIAAVTIVELGQPPVVENQQLDASQAGQFE